jgi:signal transduction histidine kinase
MREIVAKQAWSRWLLVFGLWTIIGLSFAIQSYLTRSEIGNPVTWRFALGRNLVDWYLFALLSVPSLGLARRIPIEQADWRRRAVIHLAASAVFSLAWMVLRAGVVHLLQLTESGAPIGFTEAFTHALVATFFFNVLIYWVIISFSHAIDYYGRYQEREVRAAELEKRLAEAKLQALQMQLNPHFLFNTLHAISALMHDNVDLADRMISRLSDLLRTTLASTDRQEVPLRQEVAFLKKYLEIEQTRFGERLQVKMSIEPDTWDALVPNLILQPLVENAIRHGIEPQAKPGVVELSARGDNGCLHLEVRDNGVGLRAARPIREGVGLSNTRARLQELYGAEHQFEIADAAAGGLVVRMVIPMRKEPAPASETDRKPTAVFR